MSFDRLRLHSLKEIDEVVEPERGLEVSMSEIRRVDSGAQ